MGWMAEIDSLGVEPVEQERGECHSKDSPLVARWMIYCPICGEYLRRD
jgi:hypothetical protein